MIKRTIILLTSILLISFLFDYQSLTATNNKSKNNSINFYDKYSTPWVDSVFNSLTLEERIGQLLMIRVHTDQKVSQERVHDVLINKILSDEELTYFDSIINLIEKYNVGGVAFFKGYPHRQVSKTNLFQKHTKVPLFIAMDAEWGLNMRLDSTIKFPYQMTLGAITDNDLIYNMGQEIGRQLRQIGVNINFAPVADVNSNPLNPVINFRSFGECRYNVAGKSVAYMRGMQDWGIIANAKHFPGHGDTYTDSHFTLPIIEHEHNLIDSIHLYPFKVLFDSGVKSIMTAHLHIPAYDDTKDLAATLSENVVTELLQNQLGFDGLIITDALDMRGVSDYFESGELELRALKAGNDILLLPEDVPAAIKRIKNAVKNNEISEAYVNKKCRKILFYKEQAGLNNFKPLPEKNIKKKLNTERSNILNKQLAENAITLVRNNDDIIPIREFNNKKIASLAIGNNEETINTFQKTLLNYYPVDIHRMPKNFSSSEARRMVNDLKEYDLVIISLHNNSRASRINYGINNNIIGIVNEISKNNKVVLNVFANPYSIGLFRNLNDKEAVLVSYQDGDNFERASAEIIFGGLPAKGRLPVSINPLLPAGFGINTPDNFRVRFREPIKAGIYPGIEKTIDSIVNYGIKEKAYPGAQVVVIKDGNVIINKSYGHHRYDSLREVLNSDIYDLASLTKIASTTAAVMNLKSKGLIDIENTVGYYLPRFKNSEISDINLKEILAHQARFQSWIPFYLETIKDGKLDSLIYSNTLSDEYPVKVAENIYIHKSYSDSIFKKIKESPLISRKRYLYSDVGFYLLAEIIEEVSSLRLEEYVSKHFYNPMGLNTMTYNPLSKFEKSKIAPSENDTIFRNQILQGYVNDPGAAMLGGVAGHAGLFSNALDMAIMMQMFLQNGYYAGKQYIDKDIVKEFTSTQFSNNRRGLGFDKPCIDDNKNGFPTSDKASKYSFGHTGFTGTYAWADPKENLVYVFLSNRTYPDSSNRNIIELQIRTKIQEAIYKAIEKTHYYN